MSAPTVLPGRRRLLQFASALLLTACAGRPPQRPDDEEARRRFTERGYLPTLPHREESFRDTWQVDGEDLTLELLLPRGLGHAPLVLYLPGLGEPPGAGQAWRQSWAQAGYAVASFHSAAGTGVWSSPAARRGDFSAIAREQFGSAALARRIRQARLVLDGIAQRSGQPPYRHIDLRHIALAGFDLGAQTALAFAGERHTGLTEEANAALALPALDAVIALSPPVRGAQDEPEGRFGAIRLPLLLLTGRDDADPLDPALAPQQRQLPYRYLPPGDKYLLVLAQGAHRTLSGSAQPTAGRDERPAGGPSGGRGPGGGAGGPPGGGAGGFGGGAGGPGGSRGGRPPGGGAPDGADDARREQTILTQVSLAFLDAALKDGGRAREWLARDVSHWIGDAGTWQAK
ncbi:alpha/beta hydrolase family protein [Pseudothauera rhizosphaerae]|uniref:Alpha/beta hydrolase n=1 Tax=Pseudothauera rhizosphaerae TaxID=2565932 RepID=A0A4S4AYJ1_9RHOO|nr:alpha/beta hydrolase [Pseudothauera rhizosphaerae]THF65195.1 alpha/beta hydrolase [Pseudothauera rhizosphaerae]